MDNVSIIDPKYMVGTFMYVVGYIKVTLFITITSVVFGASF